MAKSSGVKFYVKDLVRGLGGFYEMHTQIGVWNQDVRTRIEQLLEQVLGRGELLSAQVSARIEQLSEQVLMATRINEVNALQVVEQISDCRQLTTEITVGVQSIIDRALNELSGDHGPLLELHQVSRKIDELSTVVAGIVQNRQGVRHQKIRNSLYRNGLFVVGHARTGTSILRAALNTSPEIFLLGEANLHLSHNKPSFAAWYREMHEKVFNNTPSKNTSCPDPKDPAGDAWDVLLTLRQNYRLVGDKMAFRSRRLGYDFYGSYRFLQDYFLGSHIICTLRNPRDVLGSNALMFRPSDLNEYVLSYFECLALQIDLVSTFDHATILVHESISPDTFVHLGEWLDCDLRNAYSSWYEPHYADARHTVPVGLQTDLLEMAESYYYRLRRNFESGPCGRPSMIDLVRIRHDLRADIAHVDAQIQSSGTGPVERR
jgi:hypothetical protein